jgi:SAM-dependent methyltransferase
MITQEKKTFFQAYDWARDWRDLPWAHGEPTLFLAEVCRKRKPGTALDIGCGGGTDSVFLAQQGWDVTALDFMPKALEYTQQRAKDAGVKVTPVEADITQWKIPRTFDLVLDHGLLHNMDRERYAAYREQALKALADDGDFLLVHWHPRYSGQGNGKMGPTRVGREDIQAFFAPELQERFFALEDFEDLPDIVGGGMSQAYYWFRRNQAQLKPAVLLGQIKATLKRHGIDADALLKAAGSKPPGGELPAGLLGRILGPGRLGICHRLPGPGEAQGVLRDWAGHAGESPGDVENLLTLFASEHHGKVCNAGAPRCSECEVHICKRLRYR